MMTLLTSLLWLVAPASKPAAAQTPTAESLLEAARKSAARERSLDQVDRLAVSGAFKSSGAGGSSSAGRRDFKVLLPDQALLSMTGEGIPQPWINHRQTGSIEVRRGRELIKGAGRKVQRPEWQLTRTLLALLLRSFPDRPLSFEYAGVGTTRSGDACWLVTAKDGWGVATTLLFHKTTQRLVGFRFDEEGGPAEIEVLDHRAEDGLVLPHLLRKYVGGRQLDEWTLDKVVVNPALSLADFNAGDPLGGLRQ